AARPPCRRLALPTARGRPDLPGPAACRACREAGARSCPLEIGLEEIDVDRVARRCRRAPQLPRAEAHAVTVLGLLAQAGGVSVGIDEDAVIAVDDAALAPRIARQPRVARGMDVACDDLVAGLELRRHVVVHARGAGGAQAAGDVV